MPDGSELHGTACDSHLEIGPAHFEIGQSGTRRGTLQRSVTRADIGLHCGKRHTLTLRPAPDGCGIVFRRIDIAGPDNEIPARWDIVTDTTLSTTLSNHAGVSVSTVEHLMAALAGSAVDDVVIEIDGPEIPIMDGSAAPFVEMIREAGICAHPSSRRALRILREVRVTDGDAAISIAPDTDFSVDFRIDFDTDLIEESALDVRLVNGTFNKSISAARTFCFHADIDRMHAAGFGLGGSLDNAVVIGEERILNDGGLRYRDEPVRHKVLDCIGDLYLVGGAILGRVTAYKSGHTLNNKLLHAVFADAQAYEWVTAEAPEPVAGAA